MDVATASRPGRRNPKLGDGAPSLIFVDDMGDLFFDEHAYAHMNAVCDTIAFSDHIGLLLTKRTGRMTAYFRAQKRRTVRRWREKLWLGFSAERQQEFDQRWPDIRELAHERAVCLGQYRADARTGDAATRFPRARTSHLGHRRG